MCPVAYILKVAGAYGHSIGLSSEVLLLDWGHHRPSKLRDFESRARSLRYQALGRACVQKGIYSLLLGHHRDDQVETVLTRIIEGYTGVGLAGIKKCTGIPECEEVYGAKYGGSVGGSVCSGGSNDDRGAPWESGRGMAQIKQQECAVDWSESKSFRGLTENKKHCRKFFQKSSGVTLDKVYKPPAGITIHRPLLCFTKEELLQTCKENHVPYIEDHTNHDKSLTMRNTLRYLLNSAMLPRALHSSYVLHTQEKTQEALIKCRMQVATWISKTELHTFDMRSGTLVLRMPHRSMFETKTLHPTMYQRVVQWYLQYFAQCVSSTDVTDMNIPPALQSHFVSANGAARRFNIGGTLWTPISSSNSPGQLWMLSREPARRSSPIQPASWDSDESDAQWKLWDGRFWIKVRLNGTAAVVCRELQQSDLTRLQQTQEKWRIEAMNGALRALSRHHIRYNLPVLLEPSSQTILALPTLGLDTTHLARHGISYEVAYKALPSIISAHDHT